MMRRLGCGLLVGAVLGLLLAARRGFRDAEYVAICTAGSAVVCAVIAVLFGERFIEHL